MSNGETLPPLPSSSDESPASSGAEEKGNKGALPPPPSFSLPSEENEGEGEGEGEGGEEEGEESTEPVPMQENEETMKLYPKKHLKEIPESEIAALRAALSDYGRKMRYITEDGQEGEVNAEILTRIVLSRPSLLHGANWILSQVDEVKDEAVKRDIIESANVWRTLLKIVLRDPILSCGGSAGGGKAAVGGGIITVDVQVPTFDQMKSYLFFSKENRKYMSTSSNKFGPSTVPMSKGHLINENNVYYYYLKQLIVVHKDKYQNACHRHFDLDVSYLRQDRETVHASKLINLMPVWSHLDPWSDGFVGCDSNMGVSVSNETVTVAYKGRSFRRYDLHTGCSLGGSGGCGDFVLPMDCKFLGCDVSPDVLQETRAYEFGTESWNAAYEPVWNACLAAATVKRHYKERIKSAGHAIIYDWYRTGEKIKVVVDSPEKKVFENPCKSVCKTKTIEKSVIDALWMETMQPGKSTIAHLSVMKNGNVLCILEDALWRRGESDRSSRYAKRGFTVIVYRFDDEKLNFVNVSVLGRFRFDDFKKTREFVNGKEGKRYPVNVKKYVTRDCIRTSPDFGTSGKCADESPTLIDEFDYDSRPGCGCATFVINRIVRSEEEECTLSGSAGKRVSVSMLVDRIETSSREAGVETDVQDEVWSMTFFLSGPSDTKGVVATRLNKEHLGGRVNSTHFEKKYNGAARVKYAKIFKRGFYDRKRTRLCIESFSHAPMVPCTCYSLTLTDFDGRNQGETLIATWSESYGTIENSVSVNILFPGSVKKKSASTSVVSVSRPDAILPPFDSSTEVVVATTAEGVESAASTSTPVRRDGTDYENSDGYERAEIVSHRNFLGVHHVNGPFSVTNAATVLGVGRRKSHVPVTLVHKYRGKRGGIERETATMGSSTVNMEDLDERFKNLDALLGFDVHAPTNSFTAYERDVSNSPVGNYGEDYDVNFDFDKAWVMGNLIVALKTGKNSYPCVRVFKVEIPDIDSGAVVAKSDKGSAEYLLESTESTYLLNSTKLGTKKAADPYKFYGPRKEALLGNVYKTDEHVVLLIKNDPTIKSFKFESPAPSVAATEKKKGDIGFTNCKKVNDCKASPDSNVVRIYCKIWKGSWVSRYSYSPSEEEKETTNDGFVSENLGKTSTAKPIAIAIAIGDSVSDLLYDFETSKVCTNPKCKRSGCGLCEERNEHAKWYFCSRDCRDSFYELQHLFC